MSDRMVGQWPTILTSYKVQLIPKSHETLWWWRRNERSKFKCFIERVRRDARRSVIPAREQYKSGICRGLDCRSLRRRESLTRFPSLDSSWKFPRRRSERSHVSSDRSAWLTLVDSRTGDFRVITAFSSLTLIPIFWTTVMERGERGWTERTMGRGRSGMGTWRGQGRTGRRGESLRRSPAAPAHHWTCKSCAISRAPVSLILELLDAGPTRLSSRARDPLGTHDCQGWKITSLF